MPNGEVPPRYDGLSDRQLVELFLSGDGCAEGALFDKYRRYMFALAFRILHNEPRAQDVCSEVWMHITGRRERRRGVSDRTGAPRRPPLAGLQWGTDSLRPWLRTVVTRAARRAGRALSRDHAAQDRGTPSLDRERDSGREGDPIESLSLDPITRPPGALAEVQASVLVDQLWSRLEPACRELFHRFYWLGEDAADIARRAGIAVNALHQRLHRCRQQAREAIRPPSGALAP
jgi:RNA polymerase sigma factor (sigma-70 family)